MFSSINPIRRLKKAMVALQQAENRRPTSANEADRMRKKAAFDKALKRVKRVKRERQLRDLGLM